jgi:hypothetical protein
MTADVPVGARDAEVYQDVEGMPAIEPQVVEGARWVVGVDIWVVALAPVELDRARFV